MIKIGDSAKGFMKIGDMAKGFRHDNAMDRYVGVWGTVEAIANDWFSIRFDDGKCYGYPLMEYLQIQREERLKELGI